MENLNITAMIPARIGSTRFKKKNLALLNGKPMIAYSIKAALRSKVFDNIILNADDLIFKEIADYYGINFYLRPKNLGGSSIKSDDVVMDFIKKNPCDIIVWENPIAPLQTVNDIKGTIKYFFDQKLDSLFTVKEEKVQCVFHGKPVNFSEKGKFSQTQDLTPVFSFVPFIMMWRVKTFTKEMKKKGHAFFSGKVGYFPVSKLSSIIIKHEEDFLLAKMIIEGSKKNNSAVEYYEKEKIYK